MHTSSDSFRTSGADLPAQEYSNTHFNRKIDYRRRRSHKDARRAADRLMAENLRECCLFSLMEAEPILEYADFPDLPFPGMDRPYGFDELPFAAELSEVWVKFLSMGFDPVFERKSLVSDSLPELQALQERILTARKELDSLIDLRIDFLKQEIFGYQWDELFLESRMAHLEALTRLKDIDAYHVQCARECLLGYNSDPEDDISHWTEEAENIIRCALQDTAYRRFYHVRTQKIFESVRANLYEAERRYGRRSDDVSEVSECLKKAGNAFRFAADQFLHADVEEGSSARECFVARVHLIAMYEALTKE